ncbi:hypothetical protein [Pedobacter kyungheensis]|uniref:hypothetical protein n=1 Tax=Pedobacter kyungheensis TaxID=1069985 RepID=UPI0012E04545|nr:hypothetical protein [Pedobacter kyungheensis]
METQHLPVYAIVFICGALAYYLLQKIMDLLKGSERRGKPTTMDPAIIQQMVDNYRNNHLEAINKLIGIKDAHSVSFGLKTLKKFVGDIEFYAKKVDPRITDGALGVRFYYAAYPKENEWSGFENEIGKDYAQRHTLIMIPTLKKKASNGSYLDYDFNPLDRSTFPLKERSKEQPVTLMAMSSDTSGGQTREVMAQNHGQTIPPADSAIESY